jgi:hypothetical protein
MTEQQQTAFLDRWAGVGSRILSIADRGWHFEGQEARDRLFRRDLRLVDFQDLEQQLQRYEAEEKVRSLGRPATPEPIDPNAPLSPIEQMNQNMFDEAKRAADFRGTDAGRLERLIELNELILAALERRG